MLVMTVFTVEPLKHHSSPHHLLLQEINQLYCQECRWKWWCQQWCEMCRWDVEVPMMPLNGVTNCVAKHVSPNVSPIVSPFVPGRLVSPNVVENVATSFIAKSVAESGGVNSGVILSLGSGGANDVIQWWHQLCHQTCVTKCVTMCRWQVGVAHMWWKLLPPAVLPRVSLTVVVSTVV